MLETILSKLNLGEKEIAIFKLLLEYGKLSASSLCRLSSIHRTTVYSVLKELDSKGLISEDTTKTTTYFSPATQNELDRILEKETKKLEEKKNTMQELQNILKQTPSSKYHTVPKVRFVEEDEIEQYLFETTKKWYESMGNANTVWYGFQDASLVGKYEKWIDWSWKIAPDETTLKLITNYDEIEEKMKNKKYAHRRKLKRLEKTEFTATQWVIGDYVIYLQTSLKPYSLVEIHDAVLAHNTRELFKLFWK
ncbi:MAG: helix-turn-helix domain-containing protein [Patescibacteria group bacterium]